MVSRASEAQTVAIEAALGNLDGTDAAAVSLMTGLRGGELDDLGGLPEVTCSRVVVGEARCHVVERLEVLRGSIELFRDPIWGA